MEIAALGEFREDESVAEATRSFVERQTKRRGYAEREITQRLIEAIFEQRLPPGARITEDQLAEAFGVSRTVVRQSMNRLSEMGVFRKTPNRGCTVAAPTRSEVQMMLAARLMLEPPIAQAVAESWRDRDLTALEDHLSQEDAARRASDRSTLVRLTGEFHLRLAQATGNAFLVRMVTELQVLTCLAILVHADREVGCPRDEHSAIVHAIRGRDGARAANQMSHHLLHVAEELQLNRTTPERSLEHVFEWLGSDRGGTAI